MIVFYKEKYEIISSANGRVGEGRLRGSLEASSLRSRRVEQSQGGQRKEDKTSVSSLFIFILYPIKPSITRSVNKLRRDGRVRGYGRSEGRRGNSVPSIQTGAHNCPLHSGLASLLITDPSVLYPSRHTASGPNVSPAGSFQAATRGTAKLRLHSSDSRAPNFSQRPSQRRWCYEDGARRVGPSMKLTGILRVTVGRGIGRKGREDTGRPPATTEP